ncbi:hypothetical protein [Ruminococcus albus]|uniref:hypothetical protein n=1 Tax=Ruminococcus albus TaxID=1264 RepID=UPI000464D564|nr:hypothetical protein [Ruminococcus albus]
MKTKGKTTAVKKMFAIIVMVYTMIVCSAFSASAAGITTAETALGTTLSAQGGGDGWGAITQWISEATAQVKLIGYGLAAFCVMCLGIIFITGGGQGLQKGKGMAVSILVGVAVLSFGVGLIGSLQG